MSWKDKINQVFKIVTGDGKEYTPLLHQEQSGSFDPLTSSFEFSGVDGSLLKRKSSAGNTYPLTFTFDGANYLDDAANFRASARNKKAWTVSHWMYGELTVQPISISWEDTSASTTTFQVSVKETISNQYPQQSTSSKSNISELSKSIDIEGQAVVAETTFSDTAKQNVTDNIGKTNTEYSKGTKTIDDASTLENTYNTALNAVNDINANFVDVQSMARVAEEFSVTDVSKINLMLSALTTLKDNISDTMEYADKVFYTAQGATLLGALCENAVNGDYTTRTEASEVIDDINDATDSYIDDLDSITDGDFSPNPEIVENVITITDETTANFEDIINGGLIEQTYTTSKNTSVILLAHYLTGSTDNVEEIINVNNLTMDDLILVPKNKTIIYYT